LPRSFRLPRSSPPSSDPAFGAPGIGGGGGRSTPGAGGSLGGIGAVGACVPCDSKAITWVPYVSNPITFAPPPPPLRWNNTKTHYDIMHNLAAVRQRWARWWQGYRRNPYPLWATPVSVRQGDRARDFWRPLGLLDQCFF